MVASRIERSSAQKGDRARLIRKAADHVDERFGKFELRAVDPPHGLRQLAYEFVEGVGGGHRIWAANVQHEKRRAMRIQRQGFIRFARIDIHRAAFP